MGLCWRGMMRVGEGQKKHHITMMPSRLLESITWQYSKGSEPAYCACVIKVPYLEEFIDVG